MFPSIPLFAVVSAPFKRSQLGLFQGKMKQFGNSVPNSKHKTRRSWLPNVHSQRLFSDTLQRFIKIKVTARALKTIKKHGNIDSYLLNMKPDLLGWEGMRLRVLVRETQAATTGGMQAAATGETVATVS
ncbi:hypothetical protein C2E23DRAFT_743450 [Lenzites betulinus]|nr:hypothetical protein C2E23DRAFT_743450 [Lenzites betulinus]